MSLIKSITKAELAKARKDLNFQEEIRRDALRAEINTLLASGQCIFDYSDRRDLKEGDIKRICKEYARFNPEVKSYRQPGEDIAEIYFHTKL